MSIPFEETATRGRERGFRRPVRSARAAGDVHAGHGGRRLALGIAVATGVIVATHLAHAVALIEIYPPGPGPWPAWVALAAVVAGSWAATAALGYRVPDWLLACVLAGVATVVVLELLEIEGLLGIGITPTAAAAASALLMPVAALRATRAPLIASFVVGAVLAADALLQAATAGRWVVPGLVVAGSAVLPVVLTVIGVDGFRRLVRREVDLSLVQSTVATPRSAVGMRASEELAQLDFDAESLLEDVGSGRIPIPLPPDIAELAGELAARLRVRLIEGRTDTWLRHAVTESAYLSGRVRVDDPLGYAARLSPAQREGLLLALWHIVGDNPRRTTASAVVRLDLSDDFDDDRDVDLGIVIDASGISSRHVDHAMWEAVGTVGSNTTTNRRGGFRIDIDCQTDTTSWSTAAPGPGVRTRGT
ncbi:hypothetical protein ACGGZK_16330 [Agromyces sp. MMS24-K17]|uniref:hypothetical protein n=1 Tax=Agromyces sp. MMS24-K17 TaxID=3372850 RepID=UPI003753FE23